MVQLSWLSSLLWYNHPDCPLSDDTIIQTVLCLMVQSSRLSSLWWYNHPNCPLSDGTIIQTVLSLMVIKTLPLFFQSYVTMLSCLHCHHSLYIAHWFMKKANCLFTKSMPIFNCPPNGCDMLYEKFEDLSRELLFLKHSQDPSSELL